MPRDGNRWIASLASQLPQGSASNTPHSAGASLPRDGKRWIASLASQLPQGAASNTPHSVGASLPRDGNRRGASLASQLPQGLLATPRTLQERACLAMATAGSYRWQTSSHRVTDVPCAHLQPVPRTGSIRHRPPVAGSLHSRFCRSGPSPPLRRRPGGQSLPLAPGCGCRSPH